jgi:glycosyltransferase involved in cell wall biosynthesis
MSFLVVYSSNKGAMEHIVNDFCEAMEDAHFNYDLLIVQKGGLFGYLKLWLDLIIKHRGKVVIAHYGLIAFVSLMAGRKYVSYLHGSDVWVKNIRLFTQIASQFAIMNLMASKRMMDTQFGIRGKSLYFPMPVRDDLITHSFKSRSSETSRILFAGTFDRSIKGPDLAVSAVRKMPGAKLYEYKNIAKQQRFEFISSFDVLLVTSLSESGPLSVLEAIHCAVPVVTVDVGEVREYAKYGGRVIIVNRDAEAVRQGLELALSEKECLPVENTPRSFDIYVTRLRNVLKSFQ